MHYINTSSEDVSKLKKAAKLLVRVDSTLQHVQALDRVAKEAGYLHWKHVTTCAAQGPSASGGSSLASLTASKCMDPRFVRPPAPELTVISGRSGTGKSTRAIDHALNALREGRAVCVLDVGGSYRHMCELVGGTFTRVMPDGSLCEERYGAVALVVFELGALVGLPDRQGESIDLQGINPQGVLIVDELWQVTRLMGGIQTLNAVLSAQLEAGGSVTLIAQDRADADVAFESLGEGRRAIRRSMLMLR